MKIGRNQPCPCGSGKKYKRCCGNALSNPQIIVKERNLADELIRQQQQGLGRIPDFSKPGYYPLAEIYRRKQKHIDAYDIIESYSKYPQLPATFDGELPSRVKGNTYDRIIIGETYFFEGIGDRGEGITATVTSATVNEKEKIALISTSTGQIFKKNMSDDELEDYRSHPEAFWGRIEMSPRKKIENIYELFEWILNAYIDTPKEKLLEFMKGASDFSSLQKMNQSELAIEYAERCCASLERKKECNIT